MEKVYAQPLVLPGEADGSRIIISGPLRWTHLDDVIKEAMPYLLGFVGLGLLLMILRGGFTLLTSVGDAKKMEMGKQQVTQAIIGIVIIFAAYWIVQIIGIILGFEPINTIFSG